MHEVLNWYNTHVRRFEEESGHPRVHLKQVLGATHPLN